MLAGRTTGTSRDGGRMLDVHAMAARDLADGGKSFGSVPPPPQFAAAHRIRPPLPLILSLMAVIII